MAAKKAVTNNHHSSISAGTSTLMSMGRTWEVRIVYKMKGDERIDATRKGREHRGTRRRFTDPVL